MGISHHHRVVFVHVPKTGGSSVERSLGIWGHDNRGSSEPAPDIAFGKVDGVHLQHLTLIELRSSGLLDGRALTYPTVAVVRNPWDRLVSEHAYRRRRGVPVPESFADFVAAIDPVAMSADSHLRPQIDFVSDAEGRLAVDHLIRFEALDRELADLWGRLGVASEPLAHLKRTTHRHYSAVVDEPTRGRVAELYAGDISAFGYEFGSPPPLERLQRAAWLGRSWLRSVTR